MSRNRSTPLALPVWLEVCTITVVVFLAGFLRFHQWLEWPICVQEAESLLAQLGGNERSTPGSTIFAGLNPEGVRGLRLPAYNAALLALPLVFLGLRRPSQNSLALAVTLLLAFSPFHLGLASLGNSKSVLFLLAALAMIGTTFRDWLWKYASLLGFLLAVGAESFVWSEDRSNLIPGTHPLAWLLDTVGLAVPFLAGFGAFLAVQKRDVALILLVALSLLALLAVIVSQQRLLATAVAPLYLLAGHALAAFLVAARSRWLLQAAIGGLCLIPVIPGLLSQLSDNARFSVAPLIASLEEHRLPGEPLFSTVAPIVESLSGIPCRDLPATRSQLDSVLAREDRVFLVLTYDQGRIVAPYPRAIQTAVQSKSRLLARVATRRFDRHRLESRLYLLQP